MLSKRQEACDTLAKKIAELHFRNIGYAWGNSLGEYTNYDGVAYDASTKKEYKVECKFRHSTSINDYPTLLIKERKIELLNQWSPNVKLVYVWKDAYAVLSLEQVKQFPVQNKLVRENQVSYNNHMERNYVIPISPLSISIFEFNEKQKKAMEIFAAWKSELEKTGQW